MKKPLASDTDIDPDLSLTAISGKLEELVQKIERTRSRNFEQLEVIRDACYKINDGTGSALAASISSVRSSEQYLNDIRDFLDGVEASQRERKVREARKKPRADE